jgi:hypothetical protein
MTKEFLISLGLTEAQAEKVLNQYAVAPLHTPCLTAHKSAGNLYSLLV